MSERSLLTVASLVTVALMTLHLADDIVRGMEKGGITNLLAVPILVAQLYGTLLLAGRRSGNVIILLGSLLGAFVPVIHFKAAGGVAGRGIAASEGAFFWVWCLIALGVAATFAAVLSIRGLAQGFR